MAKGYWVGHVDVHDADRYQEYITANETVFAQYGGRFLIRGAPQQVKEGQARQRTVVIEFASYAAAKACYESAGYAQAMAKRLPCSTADILIVEGYGGAQPNDAFASSHEEIDHD